MTDQELQDKLFAMCQIAAGFDPKDDKPVPWSLGDSLGMMRIAQEIRRDYADLETTLAALKAEREWIPVSERMPDKPGRYLTLRDGKYDLDLFDETFRDWWYNDGVTHWMPLAAPPEGSAK